MKKSTDIRTLKNLNKPVRYSIPDSRGLHLWVRSDGKKYWVYRYTFDGTRFDMGLGSFPDISLADVRITHQRLRGLLLNGVNPSDEKRTRRAEKSTQKKSIKFSKFAFDYIERMSPKWTNRAHEAQWVATISEETEHSPEVAEMALAHTIANKVEAAYRRGKLLERRRSLLVNCITAASRCTTTATKLPNYQR